MTYDPDKLERCEACGTLLEGGVPVDEREFAEARAVWKEQVHERSMQLLAALDALAKLVCLKDGPRDDAYRAAKDAAWDEARSVLARRL